MEAPHLTGVGDLTLLALMPPVTAEPARMSKPTNAPGLPFSRQIVQKQGSAMPGSDSQCWWRGFGEGFAVSSKLPTQEWGVLAGGFAVSSIDGR